MGTISASELKALKFEQFRRKRYDVYRKYPTRWLLEVMNEPLTAVKWSAYGNAYENHTWDGDVDPLFRAWMDIANDEIGAYQKLWVAIRAATGTSKTWWLSRLILWYLDVYEDSMVITTAPRESQLTMNVWSEINRVIDKFRTARPYARLTKLTLKPEGDNPFPNVTTKNTHIAFGFAIGSSSEEESATKAQGNHRARMLIVVEETPGMKAAVMTALQNTSTGDYNVMVAVGNPDGETDELAKFGELERVNEYRISALDYPNVVLQEEVIPGAVGIGSIEFRKQKYGEDSPLYLSRVRGITPAEGDDNLIKKVWLERVLVGSARYNDQIVYKEGEVAAGIDAANSSTGDKACAVYGEGNKAFFLKDFHCPDVNSLAHNLVLSGDEIAVYNAKPEVEKNPSMRIHDYGLIKATDIGLTGQFIGIDAVGIGVGAINRFLEYGWKVQGLQGGQWLEVIPKDTFYRNGELVEQPIWQFANLRSQMLWEFREDVRNEEVILDFSSMTPEDRVSLVKEITTAKFVMSSGKIAIEKKEDIKKRLGGDSPNRFDALAYWNWARKGYRAKIVYDLPMSGGK